MSHLTLEEWAKSSDDHKLLVHNLETNLDVMTDGFNIPEEVFKSLRRVNLIVIRQFEERPRS